ncbi:phage virion morphogenesis protein [uncultured Desulfuromonas sp.]|uniref:phage virion morphogenesis protein n=1 Tax=uncultured Desulfuromonas sp. TaxID=181013 RepID=UPI002AAC4460|nr:phage virion morphogenesis protein [uncultured Desulfuromonas sp.]
MITITVTDAAVSRKLTALITDLDNPSALMADLSEVMLEDIRDHFDKEQGPDGPWEDLAASTIAGRTSRNKWPGKKLQVDGTLKNTIFPSSDADSAMVTAPAKHAAMQNFGSDGPVQVPQHRRLTTMAFGRKLKYPVWVTVKAHSVDPNIPGREFMYLSAAGRADIEATIPRHVKSVLSR